ncbi:MAG: SDR family oxidoreductase [Chitinophagales bacterium]
MKVLITGANGFLGYYFAQHLLQKGYTVLATSKGECRLPFSDQTNFSYAPMDITDPFAVHDVFEKFQPEAVIHAGAMSKPDDCEQNQWDCYMANAEGTLAVLLNAAECKSHFIFISTDFIFDGETGMYKEDDLPNPVNFYGRTKLEAEEAVKGYDYDWTIVRTVSVYGKPFSVRGNILSVIKEKLEKGEEYKVFDDQVRTPTYVEDLTEGIVSIIEKKAKGIFHLSGTDILTPYQMACLTADYLGLNKSLIKKVIASEFTQPAKRPPKTGFIIDKARKELGFEPISFEEGLKRTFL